MGIYEPCLGSAHVLGGQREKRCRHSSTGTADEACWTYLGGGRGPWQHRHRSVGVPLVLTLMMMQSVLLLLMPLVHADSAQSNLERFKEVIRNTTRQIQGCKASHLWPPNEELGNKKLLVGFVTFQTNPGNYEKIVERLGLKIPGAFSWAVDTVNKESILPDGYKMQFELYDTKGSELVSTNHVKDLLRRNASAIFGPENTCQLEGAVAAEKNRAMMSYACSNAKLYDKTKFTTFARINPSESIIISAAIEVLKQYQWKKFSILYDKEFTTTVNHLVAAAQTENMTVNHKEIFSFKNTTQSFNVTKASTRIYVYLGHHHHLYQLLHSMTMAGLYLPRNNTEYMLIYLDMNEFVPENWKTYIWHGSDLYDIMKSENESCLEPDLKNYYRRFMVVAARFPEEGEVEKLKKGVTNYNHKEPICFRSPEILNLTRHVPILRAAYLYDSVILYAKVVREIWEEMNNTSHVGDVSVVDVANNGTTIINRLKNRTYESILGYNMTLDQNVQGKGDYSVYLLDECKRLNENCSKCLVNIGNYEPQEKIPLLLDVDLSHIKDEPECGYDNPTCQKKSDEDIYKHYVSAIAGCLAVLFFFIVSILYCCCQRKREISLKCVELSYSRFDFFRNKVPKCC